MTDVEVKMGAVLKELERTRGLAQDREQKLEALSQEVQRLDWHGGRADQRQEQLREVEKALTENLRFYTEWEKTLEREIQRLLRVWEQEGTI